MIVRSRHAASSPLSAACRELMIMRTAPAGTVALLQDLAGDGPSLELAIGTGRVDPLLAATGVRVDAVEQSRAVHRRQHPAPRPGSSGPRSPGHGCRSVAHGSRQVGIESLRPLGRSVLPCGS